MSPSSPSSLTSGISLAERSYTAPSSDPVNQTEATALHMPLTTVGTAAVLALTILSSGGPSTSRIRYLRTSHEATATWFADDRRRRLTRAELRRRAVEILLKAEQYRLSLVAREAAFNAEAADS
jgi:hypothetical protein